MVGGGSKQEGIKLCGDSNKHFGDRVVGRFAPHPGASTVHLWSRCSILKIVLLCASSEKDQSTTVNMGTFINNRERL